MRLTTDLFAYCHERVPKWNTISISGYHMREKGCSAVQEVGFTLANAIAYVQAAIDAGLEVDEFGPRLAFFFNGHNNVFQEVAKFRAARRMWARIMRERFGARDERSLKIRFHTQTGGVTLAAQQPENNIVRVALQGFAAVCGGTQSLHTNGFDEALALPTERAARIALRTQQILAHESGAADTADPFAGSYFVEALTDEIEAGAQALIDKVEELGGSVECIPFIRAEVEESAWGYEERYKQKQDIVVGVNEYVTDQVDEVEILRVDPEAERQQVERLTAFKADRDQELVRTRLDELRAAAKGSEQPAAADARRAEGPLHARRGVRRAARRVRRVLGGLTRCGGSSLPLAVLVAGRRRRRPRTRGSAPSTRPRATSAASTGRAGRSCAATCSASTTPPSRSIAATAASACTSRTPCRPGRCCLRRHAEARPVPLPVAHHRPHLPQQAERARLQAHSRAPVHVLAARPSGRFRRFSPVTRYEWLLLLHLIGAFASMGSVVVFSVLMAGGARVAGPQLTFLGRRLWDVGGMLTLVFGVWLALDVDGYGLLDGWILIGVRCSGRSRGPRESGSASCTRRASRRRPAASSRSMRSWPCAVTALLVVMIYKPGA